MGKMLGKTLLFTVKCASLATAGLFWGIFASSAFKELKKSETEDSMEDELHNTTE